MIRFPVVQARVAQGAAYRQGEVVILKVLQNLGKGLWRVSGRGMALVIKSEIALTLGDTITTRVDRAGRTTFLRLVSRPVIPSGSSLSDKMQDVLSKMVLQAARHFFPSGNTNAIRSILNTFSRLKRKDRISASVLGLLAAKGFEPNEHFAETIVESVDYSGAREESGKRESRQQSSFDEKDGIEQQLREQFLITSEEGNLLQLFNHVEAKPENWVVFPYQVHQAGEQMGGTVRLKIGGNRRIMQMVLSVEEPKTTFSLSWPPDAGSAIHIHSDDNRLGHALIDNKRRLGEKLRNLNLIIDDNKTEGDVDPFSLDIMKPVSGVDRLV